MNWRRKRRKDIVHTDQDSGKQIGVPHGWILSAWLREEVGATLGAAATMKNRLQ